MTNWWLAHKRHVYLGKSEGYAWCGRGVGVHSSLSAMREAEVIPLAAKDTTAHICKSCVRSLMADEDERTAEVRKALTDSRDRRRARMLALRRERENT